MGKSPWKSLKITSRLSQLLATLQSTPSTVYTKRRLLPLRRYDQVASKKRQLPKGTVLTGQEMRGNWHTQPVMMSSLRAEPSWWECLWSSSAAAEIWGIRYSSAVAISEQSNPSLTRRGLVILLFRILLQKDNSSGNQHSRSPFCIQTYTISLEFSQTCISKAPRSVSRIPVVSCHPHPLEEDGMVVSQAEPAIT